MTTVRLQKVLARAGVASRRAAEEMIAAGRVRVDGRVVTELGSKVDPRVAKVEVDGERIVRETPVYVVLHKPRGVVSTMNDPEGRPTVAELLKDVPGRVHPVGRLDFNTSGVLMATNDGEFTDALLHPKRVVPKAYVVKVQGQMQVVDIDRWRQGVELEEGKTNPGKVKLLRYEGDKTWLELVITEGRNQQVRRMGDATGFRVMRLARISFAGVDSEGLAPGRWRYLKADELSDLKKEYGVPRRVVSPPVELTPKRQETRPIQRGTGAHGRRDGHRPAAGPGPGGETTHPRYGGGVPARRDPGPGRGLGTGPSAREDWGGGVRRGATASDESRGPRADVGARGSRTRTTGTGGGIGAAGDAEGPYRVRGRYGAPDRRAEETPGASRPSRGGRPEPTRAPARGGPARD